MVSLFLQTKCLDSRGLCENIVLDRFSIDVIVPTFLFRLIVIMCVSKGQRRKSIAKSINI